jgi:hypothetical protein
VRDRFGRAGVPSAATAGGRAMLTGDKSLDRAFVTFCVAFGAFLVVSALRIAKAMHAF